MDTTAIAISSLVFPPQKDAATAHLHGTDRFLCHLRVRLKYFWLYDYSTLAFGLQVFF